MLLNTNIIDWGEAKAYQKPIWRARLYDDYRYYLFIGMTKDILDILVS